MQITCASLVNCFQTIWNSGCVCLCVWTSVYSNCGELQKKSVQLENRGEQWQKILIYRLKRKLWFGLRLIRIYSLKIYIHFQANNSTAHAAYLTLIFDTENKGKKPNETNNENKETKDTKHQIVVSFRYSYTHKYTRTLTKTMSIEMRIQIHMSS